MRNSNKNKQERNYSFQTEMCITAHNLKGGKEKVFSISFDRYLRLVYIILNNIPMQSGCLFKNKSFFFSLSLFCKRGETTKQASVRLKSGNKIYL